MSKQKQLGTALENRVVARAQAAGLEAHRQPGSGVFKEHPHDAVIEDVLVECKVRSTHINTTGSRYMQLDLDWLRKVQGDAAKHGFEQGVVIVNPKGSQRPLVLMDLDFFLEVLNSRKRALTFTKS